MLTNCITRGVTRSINRYNVLSEQIEQATMLALKLRDLYKESKGQIITIGGIAHAWVLLDAETWKFFYGAIDGSGHEDKPNSEGVLTRFYSYIDPLSDVEYCANEAIPDGKEEG